MYLVPFDYLYAKIITAEMFCLEVSFEFVLFPILQSQVVIHISMNDVLREMSGRELPISIIIMNSYISFTSC